MNMDLNEPIYDKIQIQIAAFFGGPIAITYMIGKNYKNLGQPTSAKGAWFFGYFISILMIILMLFTFAGSTNLKYCIPFIFVLVGTIFLEIIQGKAIRLHLKNNGATYSVSSALGIGLVCLIITILIIAITFFGLLAIIGFPAQD
jgi:hypothetical protein